MTTIANIDQLLDQTGLGFSSVFEIIPDMVFMVDREEAMLYVSSLAVRHYTDHPHSPP
jgi:hypothetical protein